MRDSHSHAHDKNKYFVFLWFCVKSVGLLFIWWAHFQGHVAGRQKKNLVCFHQINTKLWSSLQNERHHLEMFDDKIALALGLYLIVELESNTLSTELHGWVDFYHFGSGRRQTHRVSPGSILAPGGFIFLVIHMVIRYVWRNAQDLVSISQMASWRL